jgi:hypothetical protein
MLAPLTKANNRTQAERLLADQTKAIALAWRRFILTARSAPGISEALASKDINAALIALDQPIASFADGWLAAFVDAAHQTATNLGPKLVRKAQDDKAKPDVGLSFNVVDARAVTLMQRNRLNLISNLTRIQRAATRTALVAGLNDGLGTEALARTFRDSIGLTDPQQQALDSFEQALRAGRSEQLALPEDERGPVSSDAHIDRLVEAKQTQMLQSRAETIARTEGLRVTAEAQDVALRQSMEAVGQSKQLTGKEWNSTHDARTRDAHAERDGQRRRLDEAFAAGIMKPGDGGPAEAINCRCVLTYEFFDTEAELAAWLAGGS